MAVTPGTGAAWPPGGEPEGAPRDELRHGVEASLGPVTPGGRAPKSFGNKEVADFPTLLDEVLKDNKDEDKTTSDCSGKEVAGFLMMLDEVLKDHKDKDKTTSGCSDQDVVDFLTLLDEVPRDYKDKDKAATGTVTGAQPPPAAAPPRPRPSPNRRGIA